MSKYDDIRRYVDEACRNAEAAKTRLGKQSWLETAEGWLRLLPNEPESREGTRHRDRAAVRQKTGERLKDAG